jgi:ACS family hexuronate transporter-like MFS transporter
LVWLIFWFWLYETPDKQKRLGQAEHDYIHSDPDEAAASADSTGVPWKKSLGFRPTWAYSAGKMMTDGIWWFYLFWLPDFLKEQYGLSKTQLALPVATVYLIATFGSVFGGWLPMYLIHRGRAVFHARKTAMFIYACCVLPVMLAQWLGGMNMWYAIGIIGLGAAAHQAWSANIYTTVSDAFPKKAVAFVTGFGGMMGTLCSVVISKLAGWLFDHYKAMGHIETGYAIMFIISGLAYVSAWGVMHLLVPKAQRVMG